MPGYMFQALMGLWYNQYFFKKKDSCLNSAGFCCCFCLCFVCWLFSQILSRETVLLEVDPPFRLNYNCTNPLVQLRLPERNNIQTLNLQERARRECTAMTGGLPALAENVPSQPINQMITCPNKLFLWVKIFTLFCTKPGQQTKSLYQQYSKCWGSDGD